MLLVAGSSLYYAIQRVKTGETFVWLGLHAKRTDDPVLFWFDIIQWVAAIAVVWVVILVQR